MRLSNRVLAVSFALAMLTPYAHGEGVLSSGIRIGVQAGPNFATAKFDPPLDIEGPGGTKISPSGMTGLIVGALVQFNLGDWFTLQPEVAYIEKGATYSNVAGTGINVNLKASYIEIPVLAKINFNFGPLRVFGEAGPYLGFLLSSKITDGSGAINTDMKSSTKGTDYGLDVGAGVAITGIPLIEPFADIRYSVGLANISSVSSNTSKLSGTQVRVGVTF
jgi:hypothetical protein